VGLRGRLHARHVSPPLASHDVTAPTTNLRAVRIRFWKLRAGFNSVRRPVELLRRQMMPYLES
jgi:hypothetical protein